MLSICVLLPARSKLRMHRHHSRLHALIEGPELCWVLCGSRRLATVLREVILKQLQRELEWS